MAEAGGWAGDYPHGKVPSKINWQQTNYKITSFDKNKTKLLHCNTRTALILQKLQFRKLGCTVFFTFSSIFQDLAKNHDVTESMDGYKTTSILRCKTNREENNSILNCLQHVWHIVFSGSRSSLWTTPVPTSACRPIVLEGQTTLSVYTVGTLHISFQ